MKSNREIGTIVFVIGIVIFLFLSMFFGGFIMIVGAAIAIWAKDENENNNEGKGPLQ